MSASLPVQVFVKKLKKAVAKGEPGDAKRIRRNKPKYKLDHIVRERRVELFLAVWFAQHLALWGDSSVFQTRVVKYFFRISSNNAMHHVRR